MQPTGTGTSNRFEARLDALRDHRALGRPVRFYFRRREQLLYLAIGGWNTVFGYGVWALLQALLGDRLHYLVIVLIAWPINVLNAYLGYRLIVFRSHGSIIREFPRFSIVYVGGLIFGLVALPIALSILPFNIYVVQAILTAVLVVLTYLGHRYYSFNPKRRRDVAAASVYDPRIGLDD